MKRIFFLLAVLFTLGGDVRAADKAARPNFIFILADDQRANELGCTGDPIVQTPHIDRLARHGVLFENAFVTSASCMPNRTSLLTGQWERRHTIGWNSNSALSAAQWAATFPTALKRQGYVVGYLGKNHTPGLRHADFDYYYESLSSTDADSEGPPWR